MKIKPVWFAIPTVLLVCGVCRIAGPLCAFQSDIPAFLSDKGV